jgi:hypothetical protein
MNRWLRPNAVGCILLLLFFIAEGLCGEDAHPSLAAPITESPTRNLQVSTFGIPMMARCTWGDGKLADLELDWGRILGIVPIAWILVMGLGRLALDGGADPIERTLLPARRHPALWLGAYVASVPFLALIGAIRDIRDGGISGLFSPTGGTSYPLMVLMLMIVGVPLVALVLAMRRVLDRRTVRRPRFRTDAQSRPRMEWPF